MLLPRLHHVVHLGPLLTGVVPGKDGGPDSKPNRAAPLLGKSVQLWSKGLFLVTSPPKRKGVLSIVTTRASPSPCRTVPELLFFVETIV